MISSEQLQTGHNAAQHLYDFSSFLYALGITLLVKKERGQSNKQACGVRLNFFDKWGLGYRTQNYTPVSIF